MPNISIADLVYKDPTVRAGVTLVKELDSDIRPMSLADFDFRAYSVRPGEAAPVRLDENFYSERYPGLPDNAAFALAKASQGMKAKQIRSELKKAQKKVVAISKGHKIVAFD